MGRQLILGTAGHIDHGKTSLVRALTGVDTDRLPEEKRRGITIDLGFARLDVGDGIELGIVDVPGHEAFVRNMLAGATGIDLVLLVVAADEGVMPQTREHLAIVELLGIRRAVVALTKADLVETEWLELVEDELRELLAPTPLADAEIVAVSARTGAGLSDLTAALARAAADVPPRAANDLFRMPIDRVFTVRGTGTVVTGTVWSGTLQQDEQVRIEPAGLQARVRTLQRHGAETGQVHAGERAAVALAGLDRTLLSRGDTLLARAAWEPSRILTAHVTVVRDADAPLRQRQRVRVHIGTAEVLARVAMLDRAIEPGADDIVQLRLEQPLIARAADHLVIRSYSPVHTIAGGIVLEPAAPKRKRLSPDTRALLGALGDGAPALPALLALHGPLGVRRSELPLRTGLAPDDIAARLGELPAAPLGDLLVDRRFLDECAERIRAALAAFHAARPIDEGMERDALRRAAAPDSSTLLFDHAVQQLLADGSLANRGGSLALSGHQPAAPAALQARLDLLLATFAGAGLQPPEIQELPAELTSPGDLPALLRFLERDGRLVRLSHTRYADAAAVARAISDLRAQLRTDQPLGVAEFKNVLNLSRKHLIPLLEYFDRAGVTIRAGDDRVLAAAPQLAVE